MHPIEPYLKHFLGRAFLESPCNKIEQRYASHHKPSGMYYNTSQLSQKIIIIPQSVCT